MSPLIEDAGHVTSLARIIDGMPPGHDSYHHADDVYCECGRIFRGGYLAKRAWACHAAAAAINEAFPSPPKPSRCKAVRIAYDPETIGNTRCIYVGEHFGVPHRDEHGWFFQVHLVEGVAVQVSRLDDGQPL